MGGVAKRILLTDGSNLVVQRLKGDGSGVLLDSSPANNEAYRLVPTAEAEATLTDRHYRIVGAPVENVAKFRQDDTSKFKELSVGGRVWILVNGDQLSPFTLESKLNGDGVQVLWGALGTEGKEDEAVGDNDVRMQAWSERIAQLAPLLDPFGKCNMVALEYLKSKLR